MISGTTAWARFSVDVDLALVNSIVITCAKRAGGTILQKRYPDDTEYRDGLIWLPLTQEDTVSLRSGGETVLVELQFNFKSGAVAKSGIKPVCVSDTLATEYIDGSTPDDTQRDGGVIGVTLDDVIVVNTGWQNNAVLYVTQELTDEQQTQARVNISAADTSEVEKLSKRVEELEYKTSIGGIVVEDDGDGNVVIKNSVMDEAIEITDDGNGNLTIGG